tara:strand:+ start:749 stop:1450 length:702 start_codon:yes stop_codon:yes gene_type:complete
MTNPVICAVDTTDIDYANTLCSKLSGHIGMIKIGLEFFTTHGPQGVEILAKCGIPIFLDLKLHDIPNTVAKTIKGLMQLDVALLTIHASGGFEMMSAAAQMAAQESERLGKPRPLVVGVTVLTSMNETDLAQVGIQNLPDSQVSLLAKLAKEAGLDGVVCSPLEIEVVRAVCGNAFKTVVPGIRPEGSDKGDQKRILTPKEAMDKGADYLVIGRPITQSENPAQTAKAICDTL